MNNKYLVIISDKNDDIYSLSFQFDCLTDALHFIEISALSSTNTITLKTIIIKLI